MRTCQSIREDNLEETHVETKLHTYGKNDQHKIFPLKCFNCNVWLEHANEEFPFSKGKKQTKSSYHALD